MGLGSCWIGYLNVREASAILGLPPGYACLFLIPVGYADAKPRPYGASRSTRSPFVTGGAEDPRSRPSLALAARSPRA